MTEDEILAHAEARANMSTEHPTEDDFQQAECDIRDMVREGWTYTEAGGWDAPDADPLGDVSAFVSEVARRYRDGETRDTIAVPGRLYDWAKARGVNVSRMVRITSDGRTS